RSGGRLVQTVKKVSMKADQMKTARPGGVRLRTPVWLTLAAALALSGCATHSAYEQPTVQVPGAWQQGQGAALAAPASLSPWWPALQDPVLMQLIDDALARNNN